MFQTVEQQNETLEWAVLATHELTDKPIRSDPRIGGQAPPNFACPRTASSASLSLRIKTVCCARPDPDQSEHSKDADRSRESSELT